MHCPPSLTFLPFFPNIVKAFPYGTVNKDYLELLPRCLCGYKTNRLFFMNLGGPIIIIEDDKDDQEMLRVAFEKLDYPNEVCFFDNGALALEYLNRTDIIPFLILSDINMPVLDGFALRDKVKMDAKLQLKCIPYLFFTTASNQDIIIDAYSRSVQGFFIKPNSIAVLENTIRVIMEYWSLCASPNKSRLLA
jgi:CheY-like chemotaxis protein